MRAGLNDLLALRGVAARGLDFAGRRQRDPAAGHGGYVAAPPSPAGRGLQFAESRPYQHGDDVRSIDWKVTARHGRPHTKLFETERERPLWIVVDQTASLQFGSRVRFKSVLAAQAAAWLAWSGCAAGDRVGGLVLGDRGAAVVPPKRGERGVLGLIDALCQPAAIAGRPTGATRQADRAAPRNESSAAPANLSDALATLLPGLRSGDRVCLLSDFYALDQPESAARLTGQLAALRARGDLLVLQLSDPLEVEPPPAGLYPLARAAGPGWLDLADPATRAAWRSAYRQRTDALQALALRQGWPVLALSTDGDWLLALSALAVGR